MNWWRLTKGKRGIINYCSRNRNTKKLNYNCIYSEEVGKHAAASFCILTVFSNRRSLYNPDPCKDLSHFSSAFARNNLN